MSQDEQEILSDSPRSVICDIHKCVQISSDFRTFDSRNRLFIHDLHSFCGDLNPGLLSITRHVGLTQRATDGEHHNLIDYGRITPVLVTVVLNVPHSYVPHNAVWHCRNLDAITAL